MNLNISETKAYYDAIAPEALCDCAYCRNYRARIRTAYPKIAAWLDSIGINIEKPFETSPAEPDNRGMLEYCGCQYIVFGICEPDYHHRIDDIEIRVARSHPGTGLEREHFVLEFFPITLKFGKEMPM